MSSGFYCHTAPPNTTVPSRSSQSSLGVTNPCSLDLVTGSQKSQSFLSLSPSVLPSLLPSLLASLLPSLPSLGWPLDPPACTSQVLEWQVWVTLHSLYSAADGVLGFTGILDRSLSTGFSPLFQFEPVLLVFLFSRFGFECGFPAFTIRSQDFQHLRDTWDGMGRTQVSHEELKTACSASY